jgi:hypothetical protein
MSGNGQTQNVGRPRVDPLPNPVPLTAGVRQALGSGVEASAEVNLAIVNLSQAAHETETSSGQTLQTSSQLTTLSRDLARLIQPEARA